MHAAMSDLNILLSPKELVAHAKKPFNLPFIGGPKGFAPDPDNEDEKTALECLLQEQRDVLKEERIHKKGNLSVGTWNPGEQVVEVSVTKGPHWQHFGQKKGGKMLLKPQEALFLLEQGTIELYFGGLPMSFQQAFMSMLSEEFSPDHYLVYAYFLRLGFTVLQHSTRNVGQLSRKTVTFTEKSKEESVENSNGDISIGDKPVKSSPVSHLWNSEDGVTPLVRPEDAVSTAAILSKLQVVKNQRMHSADTQSGQNSSLQIVFDVYQPGVNFKKSNPGPPDFCITVCRYSDMPPSLASMNSLSQQCHPVPLKIALVDGGNILFYSILDVDSPTFITRG